MMILYSIAPQYTVKATM